MPDCPSPPLTAGCSVAAARFVLQAVEADSQIVPLTGEIEPIALQTVLTVAEFAAAKAEVVEVAAVSLAGNGVAHEGSDSVGTRVKPSGIDAGSL